MPRPQPPTLPVYRVVSEDAVARLLEHTNARLDALNEEAQRVLDLLKSVESG